MLGRNLEDAWEKLSAWKKPRKCLEKNLDETWKMLGRNLVDAEEKLGKCLGATWPTFRCSKILLEDIWKILDRYLEDNGKLL